MNTKDKYIQKLEELKDSLRNLSNRYYAIDMAYVIYKHDLDPIIDELESELSSLKAEIEKEEKSKYAIEIQHDKVENVTISGGTIIGED